WWVPSPSLLPAERSPEVWITKPTDGLYDYRPIVGMSIEMSRRIEQGQATKQQLVEVATGLFAEHGYGGTSIEAVLAASGVSRGALYHHFSSKEVLFEAVLEAVETSITARIVDAARHADTPVAALRSGCRAWLRVADDPVAHQIALLDAPSVVGWQRWREIDGRHAF